MTQTPIQQVFSAFIEYRHKINKSKPVQSKIQDTKIQQAINHIGLNDTLLIFEYLTHSNDEYVAFMNGDNEQKRFYGTLDNILRFTKLGEKVQRAKAWKQKIETKKKNQAHAIFLPYQIVDNDEYQQYIANEFIDEECEQIQQIGSQQTLFAIQQQKISSEKKQ